MRNGQYRDDSVNLELNISPMPDTFNYNSTTHEMNVFNTPLIIKPVHLFSTISHSTCAVDAFLKFTRFEDAENSLRLDMQITRFNASENCFVNKLELGIVHPIKEDLMQKVSNFSMVLTLSCIVFLYMMLAQLKEALENNLIAQRLSLMTLSWNTIWNFCYFYVLLTIALDGQYFHYLALPAFMYFVVCFIFEIRLLLVVWKGRNLELFNQGNETVRRSLVNFYIRFYLLAFIGFIFIRYIIVNPILVSLLNGCVWIPQILENVRNRSRNTPQIKFAVSLSVSQVLVPVYLRGCPENLLYLEPMYWWTAVFIGLHAGSILMMHL